MELVNKKMKINAISSDIIIFYKKYLFFKYKNNIEINKISIDNNLQLKIIHSLLFITKEIYYYKNELFI